MFKKLFGTGWKTLTGTFLKFIVAPMLAGVDAGIGAIVEHVGEALIVAGVAHKIEKAGNGGAEF